jgi:hypothetical protein
MLLTLTPFGVKRGHFLPNRFKKRNKNFSPVKQNFSLKKGNSSNVTTYDGKDSLNNHYTTTLSAMTESKHA